MRQQAQDAMNELMMAASFIRREVLALPADKVSKVYAAEPRLAPYRAYLDNLRRRAVARAEPRRRARAGAAGRQSLGGDRPERDPVAARGRLQRHPQRHPLADGEGRAGARRPAHPGQLQPLPAVARPRRARGGRDRLPGHAAPVPARAGGDARRAVQARRRLRARPRLRHRAGGLHRQGRRLDGGVRQPARHRRGQPAAAAPLRRAAQEGARTARRAPLRPLHPARGGGRGRHPVPAGAADHHRGAQAARPGVRQGARRGARPAQRLARPLPAHGQGERRLSRRASTGSIRT